MEDAGAGAVVANVALAATGGFSTIGKSGWVAGGHCKGEFELCKDLQKCD